MASFVDYVVLHAQGDKADTAAPRFAAKSSSLSRAPMAAMVATVGQ